jgi:hypothetical protein
LALVRNLINGHVDSTNYVISEDGMVIDAISRQLNNASAPACAFRLLFSTLYLMNCSSINAMLRSSPTCSRNKN